jgi:hypothetical protein
MGALLGPVGGLVRLKGSSSLKAASDSPSAFRTSITGRRTEQVGQRSGRVWDASVNTAKPEEFHVLQQLAMGLLPGPFAWYDEMALVTNMLTPQVSTCDPAHWIGGSLGGASHQSLPAGVPRFMRSLVGAPDVWTAMAVPLPVPHSQHLVASAYVSAFSGSTARLKVRELDPEGAVVKEHNGTTATGAVLERVVVPLATSVRTVAVQITVLSALTIAAPAVTFTREALPWATGRGCLTASVWLPEEEIQMAVETDTDWGRRASYSMVVTELG